MNNETRPWGFFKVISDTELYKIKTLRICKNQSISLQYHNHRNEIWYIVSGFGKYINCQQGDPHTILSYKLGDTIEIPQGNIHRIMTTVDTIVYEVQIGSYFGEDDIVRLEDSYNRIKEGVDE